MGGQGVGETGSIEGEEKDTMKKLKSRHCEPRRGEAISLTARRLLRRPSLRSGLLAMTCVLLLITISGCGYTNKSLIAPGANTIFVETFQNKIDITKEPSSRQRYNVYKPFLEIKIADAIINRLLYDGNLNVVDRQSAQFLLQGELTNYIRQPLKYSDAQEIQEYRLSVMVNFTLKDSKSDEIILQQKDLTADTTYFVTGKSAKTEDSAINTLLEDLARRVTNRIIHRW